MRRPSEWVLTGGVTVLLFAAGVLLLWGLAFGLLTINP